MATKPVKGFERMLDELGLAGLVVLEDTLKELERLSRSSSKVKASRASLALQYASKFEKAPSIGPGPVDEKIAAYALDKGFIIATMDEDLRRKLRSLGITTITCKDDVVVVEGY